MQITIFLAIILLVPNDGFCQSYSRVCLIFAHRDGISNPKTALILATNDFLMPLNVAINHIRYFRSCENVGTHQSAQSEAVILESVWKDGGTEVNNAELITEAI